MAPLRGHWLIIENLETIECAESPSMYHTRRSGGGVEQQRRPWRRRDGQLGSAPNVQVSVRYEKQFLHVWNTSLY